MTDEKIKEFEEVSELRKKIEKAIKKYDKICSKCNFDGKECPKRMNCQNGTIWNVLKTLLGEEAK